MNYEPEGRILLAEFCGWRPQYQRQNMHDDPMIVAWHRDGFTQTVAPDPLHNDTDCMALIEALQLAGYDVETWHSGVAHMHRSNVPCRVKVSFRAGPFMPEGLACDNYREGVVTLAIEIAKAWKNETRNQ